MIKSIRDLCGMALVAHDGSVSRRVPVSPRAVFRVVAGGNSITRVDRRPNSEHEAPPKARGNCH